MRETGVLELASTITPVLQANRLTKCASHPKNCFSSLNYPLKYLFGKSIENGVVPDALKIARVSPLFKGGDPTDISNYRPISVLSCFSKILERIMYNCL